MGKLRKIGKKIGRGMKSIGRKLKSGFGKIAGAFGKLGPLGTIALSFILPGIGNFLTGMAGSGGVTGFIGTVAEGIKTAAGVVKNGVGKVFNRVTDAIEGGMNGVSQRFMKPDLTGARGAGSAFRDFVSEATGGFIDKSTVGLQETKIIGNNVKTTLIDADDYDLSKNFKTGEFNNPADAKRISDLQGENKLRRDVDSFQAKNDMDSFVRKEPTPGKVEFYKKETLEDGTYGSIMDKDKASRSFTNKSLVPKEIVAPKESVFASGDYDSFKARVKGSSEFDTYKKLTPIVAVGSEMNATKDMEEMQAEQARAAQAAYFSDTAMATLGGISNPDSNVSYFDFNNNAPSEQQLFNLQNSYSGILGTA